MLGLMVEISGKHRNLEANSFKLRRVLSFNCLGVRLSGLARMAMSAQHVQAALSQVMAWADEWGWENVKSVIC